MTLRPLTLYICLLAAIGCSSVPAGNMNAPAAIAVIAGTAPESPYTPYPEELAKLITALNRENPAIVVHLGNIIYAGNTQGLREEDIEKQIAGRKAFFDRLVPVCEYTAGELDRFRGSLSFFERATGKPAFHSFHYGSVFFLSIDSEENGTGIISEAQAGRIEDELDRNRDCAAAVILSYRPFFLRKDFAGYAATVRGADRFHALFRKYNVRAVISAAGDASSRVDLDSIAYINAGCVPMHRRDAYDRYRYHIISILNNAVTSAGRRL